MDILNRVLEKFGVGHLPVVIVLNRNCVFNAGKKLQKRRSYTRIISTQLLIQKQASRVGTFISIDYLMASYSLCVNPATN